MSEHLPAKPGPGWRENKGSHEPPKGTKGKRVAVVLRNGNRHENSVNTDTPPGWAADGRGGCRWTLCDSPFDIIWFRVL